MNKFSKKFLDWSKKIYLASLEFDEQKGMIIGNIKKFIKNDKKNNKKC